MQKAKKKRKGDLRTRISRVPKGRKYTYGTVVTVILALFVVNLLVFSDVLALGDEYVAKRKVTTIRIEAPQGDVEFGRSTNEKVKVELTQTNAEKRRIKVKAAGEEVVMIERFGMFSRFGNRPSGMPSGYKMKVWLPSYVQRVEVNARNVSGQGIVAKTVHLQTGGVSLSKVESDRLHVEATGTVKLETLRTVYGDIFSHQHVTLADVVVNERLSVETEAGEIGFSPRTAAGQIEVVTAGNVEAAKRYQAIGDGVYQLTTATRPTVRLTSETGKVVLQ